VRITYDISLEEFAALQPPFAVRPSTWQYQGALGFLGLVAVGGCMPLLLSLWRASGDLSMQTQFALCFLLLSGAGAAAVYWMRRRGQAKLEAARQRYREGVRIAYQRLHCRDQRVIEVADSGFTLSCRCGQVTRPWTELVSFSENNFMLGLRTKGEFTLISKRGFSSPGQITEFRALVLDTLERQKPAVPYGDFAYLRTDFTRASLLHILRGRGWRPLVRRAFLLSVISFFVLSAALAGRGSSFGVLPWETIPALLAFWTCLLLVRVLNKVRSAKHYFGPLRLWIAEDGISLRDQATESRFSWENFIGYLEDSRIYLLYHNPALYRIIPKRIFDERRQQEFRRLLTSKLPRFGKPMAALRANLAGKDGSEDGSNKM
jgi:hypothetical protein